MTNIIKAIIILTVMLSPIIMATSVYLIHKEYALTFKASHTLASIIELKIVECYDCENETSIISYSFRDKNNKIHFIMSESLPEDLWQGIKDGSIPALVEYYPEKSPDYHRIHGNNDLFILSIFLTISILSIFYIINIIRKKRSRKKLS